MSMLLIGAMVLWLIAGIVIGVLVGPRLRALPPRVSEDEMVRHSVEQDRRG